MPVSQSESIFFGYEALGGLDVGFVSHENDGTVWTSVLRDFIDPAFSRVKTRPIGYWVDDYGAEGFSIVRCCNRVVLLLSSCVVEVDAQWFSDWLMAGFVCHAEDERLAVVLAAHCLIHRWLISVNIKVSHASLPYIFVADNYGLKSLPIGYYLSRETRVNRRDLWIRQCCRWALHQCSDWLNIEVVGFLGDGIWPFFPRTWWVSHRKYVNQSINKLINTLGIWPSINNTRLV